MENCLQEPTRFSRSSTTTRDLCLSQRPSDGMPKVWGLQQIPDKEELLELLHKLLAAQKTQLARKCVTSFIKKLQQEPVSSSTMSARRDLWTADDAEHSYRSVRRLLCAGTCFNVVPGSTKAQCLKDFETLLGCFWNVTEFPLKGGRQFISGVLSCMLGREVSLIDIKRWFPTPTSQKMSVSDELSALLGDKGLSWPPNANCFEQCTIYRRVKCSGKQTTLLMSTEAPSATVASSAGGVWLAAVPVAFASIPPMPPGLTPDVDEEVSSSNNMQLATMLFQEASSDSAHADHVECTQGKALDAAVQTWELVLNLLGTDAGGARVPSDEWTWLNWETQT